jgi:hypothetical protein
MSSKSVEIIDKHLDQVGNHHIDVESGDKHGYGQDTEDLIAAVHEADRVYQQNKSKLYIVVTFFFIAGLWFALHFLSYYNYGDNARYSRSGLNSIFGAPS